MKIRTDFVTNSSSSSFVTITFYMKDGRKLLSKHDEVGGLGIDTFVSMKDKEILELLSKVSSGEELLNALNEKFEGTFLFDNTTHEAMAETDKSYEEHKWSDKPNYLKVCAIDDFSKVDLIKFTEKWSDDECNLTKTKTYDPELKELTKRKPAKV